MTSIAFLALASVALPHIDVDPGVFADDVEVVDTRHERIELQTSLMIWPRGTHLELAQLGREVVVRADRDFDSARLEAFSRQFEQGLADMRWNDRSILLRASEGFELRPKLRGTTLDVTLVKVTPPPTPTPHQEPTPREGDIIQVRVELATGFTLSASKRAQALLLAYPNNLQIKRLVGDCEATLRRYQQAKRYYLAVDADDLPAKRVMALAGGTIAASASARDTSDFHQREVAVRGQMPATEGISVRGGLTATTSRAASQKTSATAMLLEAGASATISGELQLDVAATTWLDEGVTGASLRLSYGSVQDNYYLQASYKSPSVALPIQAFHRGSLSLFGVGAAQRLSPRARVFVDVAKRAYQINHQMMDSTLALNGGFDLLLRRQPGITLAYRLDAEYALEERQAAPDWERLGSRENHTGLISISFPIGTLAMTAAAGWTKDRFGGDGPNTSFAISSPLGVLWQLDLNAGLSSISRPGYSGTQRYGRIEITRALGSTR